MHILQLAPGNYFLLILHIVFQGRGGRVIAWGDQSAHSEKCQETELMVVGGSEAIALKANSAQLFKTSQSVRVAGMGIVHDCLAV